MSAAVLDRPTSDDRGAGTSPARLELDLRGLDFDTRRRRLFAALRALRPTEQLQLTSARVDDLYWLRCEMEARIDDRYYWVPGGETSGAAVHTFVHLCPSHARAPHTPAP